MWQTVKLGEICNFEGGSQPPKKEFVYEPADGYVRFLQIRDFKSDKNITYIPIAKKNRLCSETDILIGRYGASVGQILSGLSGAYNVALMKTIPNEELISKGWLQAYLTSPIFQKPLMEVSSRSAQNGFSKDDIYDFDVPLPPLAEQQRIVAKLDAAFAEIDETLSLTQSKIDELEKLITSCLKELGNINDAEEFTINTLCKELYAGGDAPSKDKRSLTRTDRFKIPIFSNGSENAGLYGYCEEARTVEPAITISARGTIGHIELRHEPFLPIVRLIVAIPNTDIVQIKFLKYALLGSKIFSSGSSIPQLTVPMLRELPLRIPNLPTQKEIMSKLDMIFELREKFQSIQNKKLVQLSALKSAFLAQELQSEAA